MGLIDILMGRSAQQRQEDYLHSEQAQVDYRNALLRWRNDPFRSGATLPSAPPCMTNRSKEALERVLAVDVDPAPLAGIRETRRQSRPEAVSYGNASEAMGAMGAVMSMMDPSRFGQPTTEDERAELEVQRRMAATERMDSPSVYYARVEQERRDQAQAPALPAPSVAPTKSWGKEPRPARKPEPQPIPVYNWPKPAEKSIFDRMMEGE